MQTPSRRPILIAGATASGKSALALALAQRLGGVVINADSMQVYSELRILSARPSPAEEALVPHLLYGHVSARDAYSVARWLDDVQGALARTEAENRRPIVVGGSGLYFKALLEGLSPIPDIPADIRRRWRGAAREGGAACVHAELMRRDPAMAARLAPTDAQRIVRALEVLDSTGRSLAAWQALPGRPVLSPESTFRLVVDRPRPELHARADRRFDEMMDGGAVEEVRRLLALGLTGDALAMRALGVRPIASMLAGEITAAAAAEMGKAETRQYIKRQETWLRRHMITWIRQKLDINCQLDGLIMQIIDSG